MPQIQNQSLIVRKIKVGNTDIGLTVIRSIKYVVNLWMMAALHGEVDGTLKADFQNGPYFPPSANSKIFTNKKYRHYSP